LLAAIVVLLVVASPTVSVYVAVIVLVAGPVA
jgi:hypothetical protein